MNAPHRPRTDPPPPPPRKERPEGHEAPWPTDGWGGGRPKVRGDAGGPAAASASQGGAPWREPTDASQASREAPDDHTGTQEAHETGTTRGREAKAQATMRTTALMTEARRREHAITKGRPPRGSTPRPGRDTARSPPGAGVMERPRENHETRGGRGPASTQQPPFGEMGPGLPEEAQ